MFAKTKTFVVVSALFLGVPVVSALGQAAGDGGAAPGGTPPAGAPNNGGGGGRQGRGDPAQFRQRMLDRIKTELGTTDDEFAAISPKLEAVMKAQRESRGFGGPGGRRGGGGGDTPNQPAATPSPVQAASESLQETLKNKDAKPDEIKAKLDALRAAKVQAKQDLTKAQEDLRSVLTQRQEAALVMMSMLE